MALVTLNNIIDSLSTIAAAHYQINSFSSVEIADFASSGKIHYPAMNVEVEPLSLTGKTQLTTVRIWILDRLLKSKANLIDVYSDTQQISLDVIAQMNSEIYGWSIPKDQNILLQPVYESELNDEVAGWYFDLQLKFQFDYNRCRIPFNSTITNNPAVNTSVVTILDQNGNTVTTVTCGGSYSVVVFSGIQDDLSGSYSNSIVEDV